MMILQPIGLDEAHSFSFSRVEMLGRKFGQNSLDMIALIEAHVMSLSQCTAIVDYVAKDINSSCNSGSSFKTDEYVYTEFGLSDFDHNPNFHQISEVERNTIAHDIAVKILDKYCPIPF